LPTPDPQTIIPHAFAGNFCGALNFSTNLVGWSDRREVLTSGEIKKGCGHAGNSPWALLFLENHNYRLRSGLVASSFLTFFRRLVVFFVFLAI